MAESKLGKRHEKKGRSYYKPGSAKKKRFNRSGFLSQLGTGMQGILITTGDQEKLCVSEAYNLLNEYADQLYGPEFEEPTCPKESTSDSGESPSANEDLNIEAAIAKEVHNLKGGERKERRFKSVDSGAKHVVFIVCAAPVDPYQLVHFILSDIASTKIRKSRFCQRILPVTSVCRASLEDISKSAISVLEPHFHVDDTQICKFAVSYKARNNNVIKRDEVIKQIASLVTRNGDYEHIVDLSNPDITIVVEIIKNLCCLSVVKDFHKLCKYNISMLTDPVDNTPPSGLPSGGADSRISGAHQLKTNISDEKVSETVSRDFVVTPGTTADDTELSVNVSPETTEDRPTNDPNQTDNSNDTKECAILPEHEV